MNTVKKINNERLSLNSINYKGYHPGDLPNTFGFIKKESQTDDGIITNFGIKDWFNYKGLTYIKI
tara:strand:- start:338 stop:532 length:195 start_codon:yes stop_codon:yes gene_type:complete